MYKKGDLVLEMGRYGVAALGLVSHEYAVGWWKVQPIVGGDLKVLSDQWFAPAILTFVGPVALLEEGERRQRFDP
jgi:hypothetical protein